MKWCLAKCQRPGTILPSCSCLVLYADLVAEAKDGSVVPARRLGFFGFGFALFLSLICLFFLLI